MKKTLYDARKIITISYIIGLLGMLSILVLIGISREKQVLKTQQDDMYQDITASWTLDREGTKPVNVKKLGEYMDAEIGVLSMYYQLPELNEDISLVYRSKDVYTRVLVDEDVLYETDVYESRLYNKSPGNLWNVLTINSKYSAKCIEVQIYMVYDTDAVTVDSLYLGDKAEIILGIFADKMLGIVISLLLILLGIVLVVADFLPSYGRIKTHHGLAWIGLYAFFTGLWCLIETNVLQLCVEDMRILQLTDNMLMMVSNMPLLLYLDSEYKIFQNRIMRILAYIYVGFMYVCVAVQYSDIGDLHHMIIGIIAIMTGTDLILLIWIVRMFVQLKKEKKPLLNCALQLSGVCALCFFSIYESIRSSNVDQMDRAGLIRIGMLILCFCFALSSQIETYKIVEQGMKYDFVSKLAYSDGLTGLGNRTAYLERLEEYGSLEKRGEQLGIVYLDVNDLKKVNDSQGHDIGDDLITIAAKIIEDSFGHFGKSYRIGGDEFCVLMEGTDLEEKYVRGLETFKQLVDETNQTKGHAFEVQIAHGFAVCEEFTRGKIDEAIATADNAMYDNKMELKRNS